MDVSFNLYRGGIVRLRVRQESAFETAGQYSIATGNAIRPSKQALGVCEDV